MNILNINKDSGVDFPIKPLKKLSKENEVHYIGVRPEHISISNKDCLSPFLGWIILGETVVRANYHDNIIYMRCANQPDMKTGDTLNITWPDTQVHIFDKNKVRIPLG